MQSISGEMAFDLVSGEVAAYSGRASGAAVGTYISGDPTLGAAAGDILARMAVTTAGRMYMNHLHNLEKEGITLQPDQKEMVDMYSAGFEFKPDIALAMAVGAVTRYAFNVYVAPNQAAWRGASTERLQVLAQMTESQKALFNQAMAANEVFRGEITVDGVGTLGSWQTYLLKMILLDENYARTMLTHIINSDNTDAQHNILAWKMVLDFWNGIKPDLLRNVFFDVLKVGATYYGLKRLYQWYKKPQKKKKKEKKPAPKKRKRKLKQKVIESGFKPYTLFRRLDKDKSRRLTIKEIRKLAKRLNMNPRKLMKKFDLDKNGEITYAEFARYMRPRVTAKPP